MSSADFAQMCFNENRPTFIDWSSAKLDYHHSDIDAGHGALTHPFTAKTASNVDYLVREARKAGSFFVRKIIVGDWLKNMMNSSSVFKFYYSYATPAPKLRRQRKKKPARCLPKKDKTRRGLSTLHVTTTTNTAPTANKSRRYTNPEC